MTTDPLCPQQHTHPRHSPSRCIFCEYGAAVRHDARAAARAAVAAMPDPSDDKSESAYIAGVLDGYRVARIHALAAIDTLETAP